MRPNALRAAATTKAFLQPARGSWGSPKEPRCHHLPVTSPSPPHSDHPAAATRTAGTTLSSIPAATDTTAQGVHGAAACRHISCSSCLGSFGSIVCRAGFRKRSCSAQSSALTPSLNTPGRGHVGPFRLPDSSHVPITGFWLAGGYGVCVCCEGAGWG